MKTSCLALVLGLMAGSLSAEPLADVKILNDRAPDCSSLESIVQSVTRGCKTDDQRVIAIYNFCRYAYYHHAYPNEAGGVSALKMLNVYGWSLCGGEHTVLAALWEKAGYPWRYRGWSNPGHTTVEVFYGGRWHYLDTFLKFYAWMPDPQSPDGRTIAGQEDIRANPSLVSDGFVLDQTRQVCYHANDRFGYVGDKVHWTAPAFMVCGDTLDGLLQGVRSSNNAGSPRGWGSIRFDDDSYSTAVNLGAGYALTLDWNKIEGAYYFQGSNRAPRHSCGDKDYRNCPAIGPLLEPYHGLDPARSWSNGTLVFRPDLGSDACVASFHQVENVVWRDGALRPRDPASPGMVVAEMSSPYVAVKASGKIVSADARLEVSDDLAKWIEVPLAQETTSVAGKYRYWARVTFRQPVAGIELTSVVQHNQEALPYLAPGMNKITVTAADVATLGGNRLVVTYAYCLGSRDATPEEVFDRDAEIARAHFAGWSDRPVVVQKTIERFPATFEIPVPTPEGKQPVYPRMLFVRRELLAPGQSPLPVPVPPSEPKVEAGQTLATLPEPWLIGAGKPAEIPTRAVKTSVVLPVETAYASKRGETFAHHFVKWLKDDSDAWILLLDFATAKLPEAKSLASAKLILYVEEAHDQAPMQVAAVALTEAFAPGRPYDFAKLGPAAGSTIVARGAGPDHPFVPPRRYEIDVTRAVRAWARGQQKPLGLAVRIVPNRGVDDGWTVRFTPPKAKPAELELATYADP